MAPSEELTVRAEEIVRKSGLPIAVHQVALSDACEKAGEVIAAGARILISRRGIKAIIEAQYSIPMVGINISLSDYIPTIQRAAQIGGKVAFFGYQHVRDDVKTMCLLLKIDALYYTFLDDEGCEAAVREAVRAGAVLSVGGADTGRYSKKYGLDYLPVENSVESISNAIESARQLLLLQKEEARKQRELKVRMERYESIFNYTHDAILAIDRHGRIDVLNATAEKVIKPRQRPCIGRRIEEVLPGTQMRDVLKSGKKELNQLMDINGTLVSTNRIPIVVDGEIQGVVATFTDVKSLQDNEQKIRVKLAEKGLAARYTFADILGDSPAIREAVALARQYAASDSTVLLHGETGTGKELFAQSIHNASRRADKPFVAINCGSLPRSLLEAELFGYEDGAFTGARKGGKQGLFEMAHRGSIFLDEIGEMPLETQVQLLRVLQEKEIRRIGSDRVTPVDIRILTATNRDLKSLVVEKQFREDLYYRLNVLSIELPPLRLRGGDIQQIGLAAFARFAGGSCGPWEQDISRLLGRMSDYPWPGNARELNNVMERVYVLLSQGEEPQLVEQQVLRLLERTPCGPAREEPEDLGRWECERIVAALKEHGLALNETARALGMSRTTLWRKMKHWGIER